jgi:hypothetical protein
VGVDHESDHQLTPNSTPKIIASSASGRRAAERAANREEQKVLAGSWRDASLGRRSGGARHASPVWHCVECVLFVRPDSDHVAPKSWPESGRTVPSCAQRNKGVTS